MAQTKTLINSVILNCIGSGILLIPKKIADLGGNAIYAWLLTAVGSVSIGLIFAQLNHSIVGHSTIHDMVSHPFQISSPKFSHFIRSLVFWIYYIFAIFGNAVFAIEIMNIISSVAPLSVGFEVMLYLIIFSTIHFMNRFGFGVSKLFTSLLVAIKFMIILILPLLCAIKSWSNFNWGWINVHIAPKLIVSGMFSTLWAYLGIETISIGQKSSYKVLSRAVVIGSLVCAFIYILNTVLLFGMVEGLSNSNSCYTDLFQILFGIYSKQFTHLISFIIFFGMLHGWTVAASDTLQGGVGLVPDRLCYPNKYGISETALGLSGFTALLLCLILRFYLNSTNMTDYLIDTSTSLCLVVYLFGILAFINGKFKENKRKNYLLNSSLVLMAFFYCLLAFYGAPQIANLSALIIVSILGSIYAKI